MNRKSKVIVSIVGITIVLIALLGLTYAYYLTRIEGNTNTNSISVTTADLKLTYNDGDGSIIGGGKTLIPNNDTPVGTKVFTVTNNGNEKIEDYAVIIENFAVKYHTGDNAGVVTDFVNGEDGNPDMKLVITCKSYKNYGKSGEDEVGTCNGMNGFLPEKSDILVINSIDKEITHEYTAILTYLDDGTDQSDDMNKTIEGKFNIIDTKNTIDVTGTIENYNSGDTVTIHSELKESVIYTDGTYKFMGVKPDIHTIKIVGSDTTEIGKVSIKSGTTANTTGTTTNNGTTMPEVTITNDSRTLTINLTDMLQIGTIENLEKKVLLANEIINNATTNKNGTIFKERPDTIVGRDFSEDKIITHTKIQTGEFDIKYDIDSGIQAYYVIPGQPMNPGSLIEYGEFTKQNCENRINYYIVNMSDRVPGGVLKGMESDDFFGAHQIQSCINIDGKYYPVVNGTKEIITEETVSERILSIATDELGPSYYYRGTVVDNYVNFAEMCWRIVRIQGDGSIKLILEDKDSLCALSDGTWDIGYGYFGYKRIFEESLNGDVLYFDYLNATNSMADAFLNFQNTKLNGYLEKLIVPNWFWDYNSELWPFDPYSRLDYEMDDIVTPTLEGRRDWINFRDGTPMYVGALTADEVAFAGSKMPKYSEPAVTNVFSYLFQNNSKSFYTISPGLSSYGEHIMVSTSLGLTATENYNIFYRPVIVLNSTTQILLGGDGTINNPYVIAN